MENQPVEAKNNIRRFLVSGLIIGVSVLIVVAIVTIYRTDFSVQLAPEDVQLVAQGRTIYNESCASCHGAKLEGQENWQKRNADGLMPAPPHDQSGHTWHHADTVLFKLTKFGPAALIGDTYQSGMPPFNNTLSDDEIIAVLSYIKSTWPDKIKRSHDRVNEAYKQANQR